MHSQQSVQEIAGPSDHPDSPLLTLLGKDEVDPETHLRMKVDCHMRNGLPINKGPPLTYPSAAHGPLEPNLSICCTHILWAHM